jgi:sugar fermentation stimulation protein A
MIYDNVRVGTFVSRPNRFVAEVRLGGKVEICHVKNTGRCKELLIAGAEVCVRKADAPGRSTKYDLVSVWKGDRLINIDSQAPNRVWLEYLQAGRYIRDVKLIKPEARYGASRFDFYAETRRKIFMEVKGVTLEENGVAMFPDAPTERGVRHLNELIRCRREGYEAHVIFVVQMKGVRYFTSNAVTHAAFAEALAAAKTAGVKIAARDCEVTENSLTISDVVPVRV